MRDTGPTGGDRLRPLGPRHARLVELRLLGTPVDRCAAMLGISRATAFRWLARGDVRAALVAGQGESRSVATGILAGLAARAAEVLGELLADGDAGVRCRAAAQVLDRVGILAPTRIAPEKATAPVQDGVAQRLADGSLWVDGRLFRSADEA